MQSVASVHFSCLSHRSLESSCHWLPRCRLLWHHPRTYIDRAKRTCHVGIMRARTDMSAQNTGGMGGAPPAHDIGIRTDSDRGLRRRYVHIKVILGGDGWPQIAFHKHPIIVPTSSGWTPIELPIFLECLRICLCAAPLPVLVDA